MVITSGTALVRYLMDYDPKGEWDSHSYRVTRAGGGIQSYVRVGYAHGESAEFFFRETLDKLEDVRNATAGGWLGPRRFEELKQCL